MSRKRKARLDLSSPALDAIHQDNTVRSSQALTEAPPRISIMKQPKSAPTHPERSQRPQRPSASTITSELPQSQREVSSKSALKRLQAPNHPLSFRLGITDPSVVTAAETLAAQHGADPMLVLKRFVRDAMAELKINLKSGKLTKFPKITERPKAQVVLTSTVRIDRAALGALKAQIDPLDLFAASAVLGFALDQILTEMHGG